MRAPFTLHEALVSAAARSPERPALVAGDDRLTYAELEDRSARVSTALVETGVRPGDRVALVAAKTPATVAALYGVLRAGAAYVPVDPSSPPLRARAIVEDAQCRVICADGAAARIWGEAAPSAPLLALSDDVPDAAVSAAEVCSMEPDRIGRGCESDLAYVLYTSGSTGAPKGVMLTHRNALSFVEWAAERFGVTSEDRLVSHAPLHFDLSVFDVFAAAAARAALHLLPSESVGFGAALARAVEQAHLTVWYSVPSALVLLCAAATPAQVASLRVVLFAGEVFPVRQLRRLRTLVPDATLANLYGPTETNVCTYHVVPRQMADDDRPLPIGHACENQEVFVLDDERRPSPRGAVGTLWVRGPTVMKGYWGDPERTARSLVQNPLHDRFPDPAFCTGDLVRERDDGSLDFLGRRDHQIKSRGYRIELGEIEAALLSHQVVREAVVVAVPDPRIGNTLVAVVATDGEVDVLELKRHCAERVPRYMLPAQVLLRPALPRTSTGKVDRQRVAAEVAAGEESA